MDPNFINDSIGKIEVVYSVNSERGNGLFNFTDPHNISKSLFIKKEGYLLGASIINR